MIHYSKRASTEILEPRVVLDGSAELFRDLNTDPIAGEYAWLGDEMFFVADDGTGDVELWKTDGTESGTVRVKDIRPGRRSSIPKSLTATNDRVFFTAYDNEHGRELWVSDGTEQGTVMVADLNGTSLDSFSAFGQVTAAESRVYFTRNPSQLDSGLWTSDGTESGTLQLHDQLPTGIIAVGEKLYFTVDDDGHQNLWLSDGTKDGTQQLMETGADQVFDLRHLNDAVYLAGRKFDSASGFVWKLDVTSNTSTLLFDSKWQATWNAIEVAGEYVYFLLSSPTGVVTLYGSDGTAAGTLLLGSNWNRLDSLAIVGARLYFAANGQLWESDGTQKGTRRILAVEWEYSSNLVETNGDLYFTTFDLGTGSESIWRATETSITEISIPSESAGSSQIAKISGRAGKTFFWHISGAGTSAMWVTDGTQPGTVSIGPNIVGPSLGRLSPIVPVDGGFLRSDGNSGMWRSNGTAAGTYRIETSVNLYGEPTVLHGRAYYVVADQIWALDANDSEPVELRPSGVSQFAPTVGNGQMVASDRSLYFSATSDQGQQIWASDGTNEGTVPIQDLTWGLAHDGLVEWNGEVLYVEVDGRLRIAGRPPESRVLGELSTSDGVRFYPTVERLYILVSDGVWTTDATPEGTLKLATSSYSEDGVVVGNRLFWHGEFGDLWMTDGTPEGTVRSPINDISGFYSGPIVGALGDYLIFSDYEKLWKTDGTMEGSEVLAPIHVDYSSGSSSVQLGGKLYFSGSSTDAVGGELWQTDGTMEGTFQVADIAPGSDGSSTKYMTEVNGYLYFVADDGFHGYELWRLPVIPIAGDADGDGEVNFADFLILSENFGRDDADVYFTDGDFDGDGEASFADFLLLSENFGQRYTAQGPQLVESDSNSDPEIL